MAEGRDPTVPMPDDLLERIDSQLDYGDSRAEWIRQACRERLECGESDDDTAGAPAES